MNERARCATAIVEAFLASPVALLDDWQDRLDYCLDAIHVAYELGSGPEGLGEPDALLGAPNGITTPQAEPERPLALVRRLRPDPKLSAPGAEPGIPDDLTFAKTIRGPKGNANWLAILRLIRSKPRTAVAIDYPSIASAKQATYRLRGNDCKDIAFVVWTHDQGGPAVVVWKR